MILPQLTWRLLRGVSPRLISKMGFSLGWGGMRSLSAFQKRLKQGVVFPPFLFISLTNRCNLRCKGCWVTTDTAEPADLPLDKLNALMAAAKKNRCRFFGLLGGEPMLYPHLWTFLEQHRDCFFQLFTNGTVFGAEDARRLRRLGNVTPLISIEGLAEESDTRRGGKNVFRRAVDALGYCVDQKLMTGVACSLCKTNIDEMLCEGLIDDMISRGAMYLWYYVYRPAGPMPCPELALDDEQVLHARKFIVEMRCKKPILLVDSYWDADGNALCPAATGVSHHINPFGDIEPCPPVQFSDCSILDGDPNAAMINSPFLATFRQKASERSRGCILLEDPAALAGWVQECGAKDVTGRDTGLEELKRPCVCGSHYQPGKEIPEKHWMYRFAKKRWFFGFGAYG